MLFTKLPYKYWPIRVFFIQNIINFFFFYQQFLSSIRLGFLCLLCSALFSISLLYCSCEFLPLALCAGLLFYIYCCFKKKVFYIFIFNTILIFLFLIFFIPNKCWYGAEEPSQVTFRACVEA